MADKNKIIRDFENMRFFSILDSNDKSSSILVKRTRMNYDENKYIPEIFIFEGQVKKKIKTVGNILTAKFLDDKNIIVCEKNKNLTNFVIYPKKSGKRRKIFSTNLDISDFYVADSENILFVTEEKYDKKKQKEDFKYEIDSINFVDNGQGYTFNNICRLYRYDLKNNKKTLLSGEDENVIDLIKDGKEAFLISSPKKEIFSIENRLYSISFEDYKVKCLYDRDDMEFSHACRIKDSIIAVANDQKEYGLNQNPKFYQIENNSIELYLENQNNMDNSINSDIRYGSSPSIVKKDEILYFISTRDDRASIYALDEKKIKKVFDEITVIDGFCFAGDLMYICGFDKQNMQEIYLLKNSDLKKITNAGEKFKKHIEDFKIESFEFENVKKLKGYIVYPENFDENKKYPTVLSIHGGPKTVYSDNFIYDTYYLCQNGFAVIFTNPHGSDNFDNEFADIRGKYGETDYDDLMSFTDEAVKRYSFIDSDRLFVIGGSYGGFMTNWIVSHTDRFKAAVSQRCISNWISFYSTSDIGYYFATDQNGCGYDTKKLWEKSPLKYVENVKTPVLFIHSDQDYRCPLEQAVQFYTHLKLKGVKTKLIVYRGQNHDLSRTGSVKSRVSRLYEMTLWLEENSKK